MRTRDQINEDRDSFLNEIDDLEAEIDDLKASIRYKERRLRELDEEEGELELLLTQDSGRIESLLSLSTLTGSERDSLEIMINTGTHHLQRIREIEVSHFSEVLA